MAQRVPERYETTKDRQSAVCKRSHRQREKRGISSFRACPRPGVGMYLSFVSPECACLLSLCRVFCLHAAFPASIEQSRLWHFFNTCYRNLFCDGCSFLIQSPTTVRRRKPVAASGASRRRLLSTLVAVHD